MADNEQIFASDRKKTAAGRRTAPLPRNPVEPVARLYTPDSVLDSAESGGRDVQRFEQQNSWSIDRTTHEEK